jgi:hypothetical protein
MLAGIAGVSRVEDLILSVYGLYTFEKQMKDAGIEFDWDQI